MTLSLTPPGAWRWSNAWQWWALAAAPKWQDDLANRDDATVAKPLGTEAGDAAFEEFFRHHYRDIFHFLWHLTREEQSASDLAQEAFLRAWQQFAKVRAYDQPRAWLFRIATNLAIDAQRRGATPVGSAGALHERLAASDPALRVVDRLDSQRAINAAMLALPVKLRTALVLKAVYGQSSQEIASALGISVVAARMTLSRARAEFKKHFARHEEGR